MSPRNSNSDARRFWCTSLLRAIRPRAPSPTWSASSMNSTSGAIARSTWLARAMFRSATPTYSFSRRKCPGFDDPCSCAAEGPRLAGYGAYGHVDALATPVRIKGETGIPFERAARVKAADDTRVAGAFRTAGEALGRGIGAVLDITNPARLLLLLPPALAQAEEGAAAAEYRAAVERAVDRYSFSSAARDGQPTLIIEDMDSDDDVKGARAAAACVLDSFISYARGEERDRTVTR